MIINTACVSDIGAVRSVNQDVVYLRKIKKNKRTVVVGAVFDGIGGLERGELASSLLSNGLSEWVNKLSLKKDFFKMEPMVLFELFRKEIERLNEVLYAFILKTNIRTGSTMSAIMIVQEQFYIIQVGDSRIYRFRGYLEQLTEDEVNMVEKEGYVTKRLTNYLGRMKKLNYQVYHGSVIPGDRFFLCTDGFYHHLLASDFSRIIENDLKEKALNEELCALVKQMLEREEKDNISVGVINCNYAKKKSFFRKKLF